MLEHEILNDRLPASLLFYGPEGSGKFHTAVELARIINCTYGGKSGCLCPSCKSISRLSSRNLFLISKSALKNTFALWRRFGVREDNAGWLYRDLRRLSINLYDEERYQKEFEKLEQYLQSPREIISRFQEIMDMIYAVLESMKGQTVSIQRIREIQRYLWMKSDEGNFKVVIIDGAECMNEEASNSILKISEDTPPQSLIIMTAVRPYLLKETILSRFRSYRFVPLSVKIRKGIVKERFGVDASYDEEPEHFDRDEMKRFSEELRERQIDPHELNKRIKSIVSNSMEIPFLDYILDTVQKEIRAGHNISIRNMYELETLMKSAAFTKDSILFAHANRELVFLNFVLNNFRRPLQ
jgi:DNA polymerase III delta prime subunit